MPRNYRAAQGAGAGSGGRAQCSVTGRALLAPALPGQHAAGLPRGQCGSQPARQFYFCSRGKQKHTRKRTLTFLHKRAFQTPCFLLSLPKANPLSEPVVPVWWPKAGGLGPLLQTSPSKHSFPLFLFHQQLLLRLSSPHIPRFYLPSANASFITPSTSRQRLLPTFPSTLHLPTLAAWTYFQTPV